MSANAPPERSESSLAEQLLWDLGFRATDFALEPVVRESETPLGAWKSGTMLVRQFSTGIQRTYTVSPGPSWMVDFETDLRRNVFASP